MYEKNFTEVDSNSVKGTVANIDCKQTRTSFKVYCFTLLNRYKSFNLDQRLGNFSTKLTQRMALNSNLTQGKTG